MALGPQKTKAEIEVEGIVETGVEMKMKMKTTI